jgi:hypothetical protein
LNKRSPQHAQGEDCGTFLGRPSQQAFFERSICLFPQQQELSPYLRTIMLPLQQTDISSLKRGTIISLELHLKQLLSNVELPQHFVVLLDFCLILLSQQILFDGSKTFLPQHFVDCPAIAGIMSPLQHIE